MEEEKKSRARLGRAEEETEAGACALRKKQEANRALAAERGQLLSRFKLLEEMEKEGQGYAQGVREVLRRRGQDKLPGILGTVAQRLRVEKEYEGAVEVALGAAAQNIITETERSAQDAIRWLKNMDKGRVTFLPLDTIRQSRPVGDGPRGKGIIGRLVDLVDFEDKYLPAMEFLLGRIWLADELSNAVARARENGFRYRIVTLDGQVVNAGGSLTGGSLKQSSGGFISRRRQLEELDREIRRLSRELIAGEEEENRLRQAWEGAKAGTGRRRRDPAPGSDGVGCRRKKPAAQRRRDPAPPEGFGSFGKPAGDRGGGAGAPGGLYPSDPAGTAAFGGRDCRKPPAGPGAAPEDFGGSKPAGCQTKPVDRTAHSVGRGRRKAEIL